MTTHAMNCTAFDETLADYLEGDLGASERQAVEAHLASCVRCAALVRDLQQIRDSAGELGELVPSRDLWDGIEARIEAPVVPLAPRDAPWRCPTARPGRFAFARCPFFQACSKSPPRCQTS